MKDKTAIVTGADAVQQSKMQREQQDVLRIKDDDVRKDAVKRVAGKTFYLIDGVWTDSEFKAESKLPETVLVFGSDEYFALLKQNTKKITINILQLLKFPNPYPCTQLYKFFIPLRNKLHTINSFQ